MGSQVLGWGFRGGTVRREPVSSRAVRPVHGARAGLLEMFLRFCSPPHHVDFGVLDMGPQSGPTYRQGCMRGWALRQATATWGTGTGVGGGAGGPGVAGKGGAGERVPGRQGHPALFCASSVLPPWERPLCEPGTRCPAVLPAGELVAWQEAEGREAGVQPGLSCVRGDVGGAQAGLRDPEDTVTLAWGQASGWHGPHPGLCQSRRWLGGWTDRWMEVTPLTGRPLGGGNRQIGALGWLPGRGWLQGARGRVGGVRGDGTGLRSQGGCELMDPQVGRKPQTVGPEIA